MISHTILRLWLAALTKRDVMLWRLHHAWYHKICWTVHKSLCITHQVLVNACIFVNMKFNWGLPKIKFHINKNKGVKTYSAINAVVSSDDTMLEPFHVGYWVDGVIAIQVLLLLVIVWNSLKQWVPKIVNLKIKTFIFDSFVLIQPA